MSENLAANVGFKNSIKEGGRLVFGQDLDSVNDSFEISQVFVGRVADFILYKEILSISEIDQFINCNFTPNDKKPFYDFQNGIDQFVPKGPTKIYQEHKDVVCQKEEKVYMFFPDLYGHKGAIRICKEYDGVLVTPMNENENKILYNKYIKYYDVCPNSWASLYWLGITGDVISKQWYKISDDSAVDFTKFQKGWGNPTERFNCATSGGPKYKYLWFSAPCDIELCVLCSSKRYPKIYVRGLCRDSKIDKVFHLYSQLNLQPFLIGKASTILFWNKTNWIFKDRYDKDFVAVMEINKPDDYPIGTHRWEVIGDNCQQGKVCRITFLNNLIW